MHHLINISQDLVSDELSAHVQSYCFSGFFSEHRIYINSFFFLQIARKLNDLIREQGLRELGQLEQDLVFGDAGMKDVIKYLSTQEVCI